MIFLQAQNNEIKLVWRCKNTRILGNIHGFNTKLYFYFVINLFQNQLFTEMYGWHIFKVTSKLLHGIAMGTFRFLV